MIASLHPVLSVSLLAAPWLQRQRDGAASSFCITTYGTYLYTPPLPVHFCSRGQCQLHQMMAHTRAACHPKEPEELCSEEKKGRP
ncbi:hypothetical protein BGX38DRAFT_1192583 [Terfezia claveryi]|nr:hypothetical protein BGX38DRAFT_1192583 [Terfezia claveryi]